MAIPKFPRSLVLISTLGFWGNSALIASAQVIPDGTLGSEASQIITNTAVQGLPADVVEGGAIRGPNLFHSFSDFNVGELQRLYFANPAGIENILSRVTGNSASNIFGTLGVTGNANLFLINPNGIIFGPNAQLDITGSFFATTADAFDFGNGALYSAANPEPPPMLTVGITPGLQYSATQRTLQSEANLAVGQNLTLAGGNLQLTGQLQAGGDLTIQAQDTVTVRDSVADSFIANAGRNLTIQGSDTVDIFALNHADSGLFSGGDLVLRSHNSVIGDARYFAQGDFKIEQMDGTLGNLLSPNDPIIRANGNVSFNAYDGASLHILAGGSVTIPGFIRIRSADPQNGLTETFTLADGTAITIDGRSRPTLDIRAGIDWATLPNNTTEGLVPGSIAPPGPQFSPAQDVSIQVGTIFFADSVNGVDVPLEGDVFLTNQYQPKQNTTGNISLLFSETSGLLAGRAVVNGDFSSENGVGSLQIHSRGDILLNGIVNLDPPQNFFTGQIQGNGGNAVLHAASNITFTPGSLINTVGLQGGSVDIRSGGTFTAFGFPSLGQSVITSTSIGDTANAKGGSISITANSVLLADAAIIESDSKGAVSGGDIFITAQNLTLLGGSEILSRAFSSGTAGNVTVQPLNYDLPSFVTLDGIAPLQFLPDGTYSSGGYSSGLFSTSEAGATGAGGVVAVKTGTLTVSNGAVISARTRSTANGGGILLDVNDLWLLNGGQVLTTSFDSGTAGPILVLASNSVNIWGNDAGYTDRFLQLRNAFYNNHPLIKDNPNPTEAQIAAASVSAQESAETIIDPVTYSSALQASNVPEYLPPTFQFNPDGPGTPGNIVIIAPTISMANQGSIEASTFGKNNSQNILIQTQNLSLESGASILAATYGNGSGGNVIIQPLDPTLPSVVEIDGFVPIQISPTTGLPEGGFSSGIFANTDANPNSPPGVTFVPSYGKGGNIEITADTINISNSGILSARTRSAGQGGSITVNVDDLTLLGGGQIVTSTFSTGSAGNIQINATGDIVIDGFDPAWSGRLSDLQAAYEALSFSEQEARNKARFTVDPVAYSSGLYSNVQSEAQANGGSISIGSGNSLHLSNFGSIVVSTNGQGNAGSFTANIKDGIILESGSGIRAGTEQGAIGNGGDVELNARFLSLTGGSTIISGVFRGADTNGDGFPDIPGGFAVDGAGDIKIHASDFISIDGIGPDFSGAENFRSGIFASTEGFAFGDAGAITIETPVLSVSNLGIINAATSNTSDAGNINLNIAEQLTVSTGGLILVDGSFQGGANPGNPGNVVINSGAILLDQGGKIQARTTSGSNANIEMTVGNAVVMSFSGSCSSCNEISTEAFGPTATGGNITISVGNGIFSSGIDDNNDIVANAEASNLGANIIVRPLGNGQGYLGVNGFRKEGPQGRTIQSDIDASSSTTVEDGTTNISNPQEVAEAPPLSLLDPTQLVDRRCELVAAAAGRSEFRVTGRGGLPPSPSDRIETSTLIEDFGPISNGSVSAGETALQGQEETANTTLPSEIIPPEIIVEPQGWVRGADGSVYLYADATPVTERPQLATECASNQP
ncbi:MAG TPA: filamentous hemagglutinin N-terminal domain-containing protein [Leptolyngbyaceae cyanobacterium]